MTVRTINAIFRKYEIDGVPGSGPHHPIKQDIIDTLSSVLIKTFDTVAEMVASSSLSIGESVTTLGYLSAGDGGENVYQIVAAATGTDDGGSFIDLATHQAQGLFPYGTIYLQQFGAAMDATDDFAALKAAGAYIPEGKELVINADATFDNTSEDIIITTDNITIRGEGNPTLTFEYFKHAGFQVRADGVKISNLTLVNSGTPADMGLDPFYLDLPARNRAAGILGYRNSNCIFENLSFDNWAVAINLSNDRSNPSTLYTDNVIRSCYTQTCDQGILFGQQDRLLIDDFRGRLTQRTQTNSGGTPIEPHVVYGTFSTDLATELIEMSNGKVTVSNIHSEDNAYDSAFKFKLCPGLQGNHWSAQTCQIICQIDECHSAQIHNIYGEDLYDTGAGTTQAVHVFDSNKVTLLGAKVLVRDDENDVTGFRANNAEDCHFVNCEFRCDRTSDSGSEAFNIGAGSHRARIIHCTYVDRGDNDEPMISISASDDCYVMFPSISGTDRVGIIRDTSSNARLLTDIALCEEGFSATLGWRDVGSINNHNHILLDGAQDHIADVSLSAVTGVDGTGNNAASKADVDTRLTTIETAINGIYTQLENFGVSKTS